MTTPENMAEVFIDIENFIIYTFISNEENYIKNLIIRSAGAI